MKFSFQRAKSSQVLKEKVREIEIVDPYRVRFHLHEPFPDFMAFYGTLATGVGLDRAQEVRREGRRRRVHEAAGRASGRTSS